MKKVSHKYNEKEALSYIEELEKKIFKKKPKDIYLYISEWCQKKGIKLLKNAEENLSKTNKKLKIENDINGQVVPDNSLKKLNSSSRPVQISNLEASDNLISRDEQYYDQIRIKIFKFDRRNAKRYDDQGIIKYDHKKKLSYSEIQFLLKKFSSLVSFFDIEEEIKIKIINQIELIDFEEAETIFEINSRIDFVGFVSKGKILVKKVIKDSEIVVKELEEGDFFGEINLFEPYVNKQKAIAIVNTSIYALNRDIYRSILKYNYQNLRERLFNSIKKIPILSNLPFEDIHRLIDCFSSKKYLFNEIIYEEKEEENKLYIVTSGRCSAFQLEQNDELKKIIDFSEGDFFGEKCLSTEITFRKTIIRVTSFDFAVSMLKKVDYLNLIK